MYGAMSIRPEVLYFEDILLYIRVAHVLGMATMLVGR